MIGIAVEIIVVFGGGRFTAICGGSPVHDEQIPDIVEINPGGKHGAGVADVIFNMIIEINEIVLQLIVGFDNIDSQLGKLF